MTVFTTPILDNFNRANESPLSAAAGWRPEAMLVLGRPCSVVSNHVGDTTNNTVGQAWGTSYGDCEAYLSISTFGGGGDVIRLFSRISTFAPNFNGYDVRVTSLTAWQISKWIANGSNVLISFSMSGFTTGRDAVGMRTYNQGSAVMIEAWARINGIWQRVAAYLDSSSPYAAPGYIGLGVDHNNTADDFGGGSASPTTINDVYPTYTNTKSDQPLLARFADKLITTPGGGLPRPTVGQLWPWGGND